MFTSTFQTSSATWLQSLGSVPLFCDSYPPLLIEIDHGPSSREKVDLGRQDTTRKHRPWPIKENDRSTEQLEAQSC